MSAIAHASKDAMTPSNEPFDPLSEGLSRWCAAQALMARDPGGPPTSRRRSRLRWIAAFLVVVALALMVLSLLAGGLGDLIWFASVGFGDAWATRFDYGAGLFLVGVLVTGLFLVGNLALAWPQLRGTAGPATAPGRGPVEAGDADPEEARITMGRAGAGAEPQRRGWVRRAVHALLFVVALPVAGLLVIVRRAAAYLAGTRLLRSAARSLDMQPTGQRPAPTGEPDLRAVSRRLIGGVFVGIALLCALYVGLQLGNAWQTVALWAHGVPYSPTGAVVPDPIFGLDLGWWLFTLPFLHLVVNAGVLVLGLALALTSAAYGVAAMRGGDLTGRRAAAHLGALGALLLLAIAATQWLGRYDLSYSQNGLVTGVTATDAAVRLPFGAALASTSVVLAIVLLVLAFARRERVTRTVVLVGAGFYAALVAASVVVPMAYQVLVVTPSQNVAEAPYVANNIALTRLGFDLDPWRIQPYTAKASLSATDVASDQGTLDNAPLWVGSVLGTTLDQLQTVRQYYDFTSVDVDRYPISGTPTEVALSAREMALSKSQPNASWVSRRVLYTHGYGVVVAQVSGADPGGLPRLLVKDLPTVSAPGAPVVTQPGIYFGRRPSDWVLVGAKSDEFDYPTTSGSGTDGTTRFTGGAGIPVGSAAARLFWAARLGDLNLLTSDQVTHETKLLLHRSLADRLGTLAPFFVLDPNPYIVVASDGHLVYVQDAYTTSRALPDATPYTDATLGSTYDYIRNSVKITVDAYDGTTHFYVADAADPLIRAWEGVFPSMFEPLSAMPADVAAHLRTPQAMFNAQVQMFARYHVTDVASFYKSDNLWTPSTVTASGKSSRAAQGYYVEMRLPGETEPEFVLIQPMLPASRPNMIAWVAARNDGAARGEVVVYQLPASTTTQGPVQVEARIDQDPVISSQLSLWNQSGSKVIRGNLMVLPVGSSFLYVEPIYLQSTKSAFPQLTKVVVASSSTVAWGDTLGEALTAVMSGAGTAGGSTGGQAGGGPVGTGPLPTDTAGLIAAANQHFTAAKAAQAAGDFVTYGREMQLLQAALAALAPPSGAGPAASPSESPSAGP